MSILTKDFFFVRHPQHDSFTLIQICGEIPKKIPKEVLHLMPGNHSGVHNDDVVLEQDEKYLKEQVMVGCPEWFSELEQVPWVNAGCLMYRKVGSYIMM